MPEETRGRLDNAIDRTVRGMMHVDPAPGLRGRVADRLEAPRANMALRYSFAAAAALIVLVVASLALFRPFRSDVVIHPGISDAPPSRSAAADPPRGAAQARPQAPALRPPIRETGVDRRRVLPRPSVVFSGARDRVSAANVRPAVLDPSAERFADDTTVPIPEGFAGIAPIVISPISIAPIVIPPLAVTPLANRR